MTDTPKPLDLTPAQELILTAAPIAQLAEVILGGAPLGRVFPGQALYRPKPSAIIKPGHEELEPVALLVPANLMAGLVRAWQRASATDDGKAVQAAVGENFGVNVAIGAAAMPQRAEGKGH